ncbi:hypothetical protein ACFFUS_20845 [Vibrio gallaecicus]|uniref:hypothetical protein n=1 Tax=Vibrio gallaecicus TaxID=552386 RepID=UPI0010C9F27A|nr:hypothetical protein [Vibrio gallaecicus]MDN3614097.1 hypothetical protein [Vibrio gallaecicus]
MKKIALVCALALAGCSTTQVEWQQDNQIKVAEATVVLKSNLWINKMPSIGEAQDQMLHGAIYLQATSELPAELAVEGLTIKQGAETWLIDGNDLELRTHGETQWEVAFKWQLEVDDTQPVDVAVQLKDGEAVKWLVEHDVKVDTVY